MHRPLLRSGASAPGAHLHLNETVVSFEQTGGSVTIKTDRDTNTRRELIVAAGPWLPDFLSGPGRPSSADPPGPLYWFRGQGAREQAYSPPGRFPVYILGRFRTPADLWLSRHRRLKTASRFPPSRITPRPRRKRWRARPVRTKSARCTRPMSGRIFPACRPPASSTRSVFTPRSTAPASSSTGTPTPIACHHRLALLGTRLQAFGRHRRAARPDGAGRGASGHRPVQLATRRAILKRGLQSRCFSVRGGRCRQHGQERCQRRNALDVEDRYLGGGESP